MGGPVREAGRLGGDGTSSVDGSHGYLCEQWIRELIIFVWAYALPHEPHDLFTSTLLRISREV